MFSEDVQCTYMCVCGTFLVPYSNCLCRCTDFGAAVVRIYMLKSTYAAFVSVFDEILGVVIRAATSHTVR